MDSTAAPLHSESNAVSSVPSESLVAAAEQAMAVESIRHLKADLSPLLGFRLTPTLEIRGRLLMASDRAYELVSQRFRAMGHVAVFRRDRGADVILAVPGELPAASGRRWLAVGFFIATLLSVFWVGGGGDITSPESSLQTLDLMSGLAFAASMLGILLAHEFGHYFAARHLGVAATLPYFIPLPLPPFGTLGAFIQMKAPPRDRRKLFAVALAGPLAGLAATVPILVLGLLLSPVQAVPSGAHYFQEGNSLLYIGIKYLLFGKFLPSGGEDVLLHPVALAGWAGLLVTGLNLIPAGQLDGGHIIYAMVGRHARWFAYGVIFVLLALSVYWQGWLLWAGLIYLFGRVRATPLDDITPLRPIERALAIIAIVVFVLIFSPIPIAMQ